MGRTCRSWMNELNPAQRQAVTCPSGPLLVIAGAGTGKTKTLACRVAWLIEQGVAPERILLLTFTRRAAAEMLARAARLTNAGARNRVWGGTFHATANRLLRQHGRALGLPADFTVLDQSDAADLMDLIRAELALSQTRQRFPKKNTLVTIYSRAVNSQSKLARLLETHFPWCAQHIDEIGRIFECYLQRKRSNHVLDYDDLLLYWLALCTTPGCKDAVADRFDHILVDEYQDTNAIQARICKAMCRSHRNITVVGDDAQAIYAFRAATVRNILEFSDQFDQTMLIKLEANYRSTQVILDAANGVMAQARSQFTKTLHSQRQSNAIKPLLVTCLDEQEQAEQVCDRVLQQREQNVALCRQAVLFRASHHSDQFEIELSRRNIPFVKYGGLKFVEAAHVKDLVALLRLMENPQDEVSWYRILQLLDGVGPATARQIVGSLRDDDGSTGQTDTARPAASPMNVLLLRPPAVPAAAHQDLERLRSAFADCLGAAPTAAPDDGDADPGDDRSGSSGRVEQMPAGAQIERLRRFYEPIFERQYENSVQRLADLDQLQQIAGRYPLRSAFLSDLTLDPPASTQDLAGPPLMDEDYLILSTIHSAKGCQWDAVHIIHAADGMIPSDMATGDKDGIDEERRLLYVAMTRARNTLNLYFPLRYYHRGRGLTDGHSYAQVSRFIAGSTLKYFECVSAQGAREDQQPHPDPPTKPASVAIDAALNELWRP